jgi:hypothetical protein
MNEAFNAVGYWEEKRGNKEGGCHLMGE